MKLLQAKAFSTHQFWIFTLATVTVVGGNNLLMSPSQAVTATTNFICGQSDGKPATVARTKKGDVPIVIWSSEGFSEAGFTPQVRCQQVSARFQSMYRSGQLKYITAGTLNQQPVVCATKKVNSACSSQNLLYTLKPNADAQQVIRKLTAIRNRSSSRGLEESSNRLAPPDSNSVELDWLDEN